MDNLFFCLNATGPIFLMMILGLFFRHIGWMDEDVCHRKNKSYLKCRCRYVIRDLATVDFSEVWNVKFVIFCFMVTLICIIISAGISCLWKDKSIPVGNLFRLLSKQRGASWYCIYPKYLWKCGYGASHDHRQCPAL